ncbi:hypothetical protein DRE_03476 [Drechslerella stenobrocha 248]|uniref:DUF3824 domain-containing protein n=1 Tax=Drechslerella stenobrocha 248 TaxID=1043628 RepID=W7I3X0_9PEZI|nr:hypothetical protein DRE_03476 [Drechslerella stenobrocha 248]
MPVIEDLDDPGYQRRTPSPTPSGTHFHYHSVAVPVVHQDDMSSYRGTMYAESQISPGARLHDPFFEDRMRHYGGQDYVVSPAHSRPVRPPVKYRYREEGIPRYRQITKYVPPHGGRASTGSLDRFDHCDYDDEAFHADREREREYEREKAMRIGFQRSGRHEHVYEKDTLVLARPPSPPPPRIIERDTIIIAPPAPQPHIHQETVDLGRRRNHRQRTYYHHHRSHHRDGSKSSGSSHSSRRHHARLEAELREERERNLQIEIQRERERRFSLSAGGGTFDTRLSGPHVGDFALAYNGRRHSRSPSPRPQRLSMSAVGRRHSANVIATHDHGYSSADDSHHHGRKAAAALGAAGLGAAALHHYRRHHSGSRSRSRSRSRSSSSRRHRSRSRLGKAALGATAAGVMLHEHNKHKRDRERGRTRSRSHSRLGKAAAATGLGAVAVHEVRKHRRQSESGYHSGSSSSRSRSHSHSRAKKAALAAAAIGVTAAAIRHHLLRTAAIPVAVRPPDDVESRTAGLALHEKRKHDREKAARRDSSVWPGADGSLNPHPLPRALDPAPGRRRPIGRAPEDENYNNNNNGKNVRIQSAPTTPNISGGPSNRPPYAGPSYAGPSYGAQSYATSSYAGAGAGPSLAPPHAARMAPQFSVASGTTEEIPRHEIPMPMPPGGYGPSDPPSRYPPSSGYVPPPQPQYVSAPKSILKNTPTASISS